METVTIKSYAYDNNGNITGIGSNVYVWDYRNRMTSSTIDSVTNTYKYDDNNIRILKGNGTATTTYPNMYYNTTTATTTKHIFMPDGTLFLKNKFVV